MMLLIIVNTLTFFALSYHEAVSIVTDTEPTMIAAKLLGKQVEGRAVKPIQDVTTRWWSTYAMCDQLLGLKMYLCLLENEVIGHVILLTHNGVLFMICTFF